jgi:S1-C subfamily serine protease
MRIRRSLLIVVAVAAAGAAGGASLGRALGDGPATAAPDPVRAATSRRPAGTAAHAEAKTPEAIYRDDSRGVVVITTTQTEVVPPTLFTPAQKRQVGALGSGFVIDARGDIVTNDHVVQGAKTIRVGFSGGTSYPATVVGADPASDIAVVRFQASSPALHPLAFSDSRDVEVGDPVYAIGNPFGLDRTMTAGIVSSVSRDIQAPDGLTIADAVQTDAPINHGNSGGPLLDRFGRVIGVNAQIEGGTVDANVGVGFAVPADTARSVAEQLIAHGHVEHPWLGVQIATIDPAVAKVVRGLPSNGVVIERVVAGSPAAKAGLEAGHRQATVNGLSVPVGGDAITKVDGVPVATSAELGEAVARHKAGDTLTLVVVRDGATRTVHVTLGDAPG